LANRWPDQDRPIADHPIGDRRLLYGSIVARLT
jgi:hypothetical protein